MAEFGKLTNGISSLARTADILVVSQATPATVGTLVSMTIRAWTPGGGSGGVPALIGVIYSDVAGVPTTLLAQTDALVPTNTTEDAHTFNFTGANIIDITAIPYWIGVIADAAASPANLTISRQGTANEALFSTAVTYPTIPGTFPATSTTQGPIDCFVTYTPENKSQALFLGINF